MKLFWFKEDNYITDGKHALGHNWPRYSIFIVICMANAGQITVHQLLWLCVGPVLGQCQHATCNNGVLPLPNVGPTFACYLGNTHSWKKTTNSNSKGMLFELVKHLYIYSKKMQYIAKYHYEYALLDVGGGGSGDCNHWYLIRYKYHCHLCSYCNN